jgi:hypothetical protein
VEERAERVTEPWVENELSQSPARAAQNRCFALAGLNQNAILSPGFGCYAAFTLGFVIARFQRYAANSERVTSLKYEWLTIIHTSSFLRRSLL